MLAFVENRVSTPSKARAVDYNMESYLKSAVDRHCELAAEVTGHAFKLKYGATSFLTEGN